MAKTSERYYLESEARRRRDAAVAVAGEVVLARHFGFEANGKILIDPKSERDGVLQRFALGGHRQTRADGRRWVGHAEIHGRPTANLDPVEEQMIAFVGVATDGVWCGATPDGVIGTIEGEGWDHSITPDDPSSYELGPNQVEGIRRAMALFDPNGGPLWKELVRVSRVMIVASRPRKHRLRVIGS